MPSSQVIIFGHAPPGKFERDYSSSGHHWLGAEYNDKYVGVVQRFADIVTAQFFGHQHTDSFRIFKDLQGRSK